MRISCVGIASAPTRCFGCGERHDVTDHGPSRASFERTPRFLRPRADGRLTPPAPAGITGESSDTPAEPSAKETNVESKPEKRLQELHLTLPDAPKPVAKYKPAVLT